MKSTLLPVLLSVGIALASFGPNVRVDHVDRPECWCLNAAITVDRASGDVYVVFEVDSIETLGGDIYFQKSTDVGQTWLAEDVLVRLGSPYACGSDITADKNGNVYIAYCDWSKTMGGHVYCVRSSDGGATWSTPGQVDDNGSGVYFGRANLATDTAGRLLCAWNDTRLGGRHIWSSVSTDGGATWSANVRVCDDTSDGDCYTGDAFVQPGTNHYLVGADAPYAGRRAFLYRSTDMGQTFQAGIQLDTFGATSKPNVAADSQHIICVYTDRSGEYARTKVRALYTLPDTWGPRSTVNDTDYNAYASQFALSPGGRVHVALMMNWLNGYYRPYYAVSTDYGVTWSRHELVSDDTTDEACYPAIDVDSAGHVYMVWQDWRTHRYAQIWFSTNDPAGVAEQPARQSVGVQPFATVVRNVLFLVERPDSSASTSSLLDISGRDVLDLKPGANDVRSLPPGVYFVREQPQIASLRRPAVRKVMIAR